ncbi:dormancy-associated protein homolog 3-like isoform X2 [Cynara cardunculus var. scolymus]|uniref:dormancy-associated protein homolog 3-like isoform X2 n=1 Tax=Cynara cardunculus var. scolymus TaxID=59895 RepID=UPI000D6238F2|nr:dormancy-associated protein homolog 3-like isoform X2 [Cynara cardunculus var. scolymus]
MSLLAKLWDDTVAGPPPEKGLGKLRKQSNLSFRSLNSDKESETVGNTAVEYPSMKVTRSIMIVKPERSLGETPPASPAASTPPVSPFAGGSDSFRFRRKSASDNFEKASGIGSRNPRPPYEQ